jgi:C4-dicarboxylate transporter, DctQ subunit
MKSRPEAMVSRLGLLRNFLDRVMQVMFVLAGVLLTLTMLAVSAGVASRYLFNRPLGWVVELVEYGLLYIAFLVPPLVLKRGAHIRMDLIFNRLSPKVQSILTIVGSGMSAVICLILCWFGIRVTLELYHTAYTTPTLLEAPKFIIIAVVPIGSAVLSLQFLIMTLDHILFRRTSLCEKNTSH